MIVFDVGKSTTRDLAPLQSGRAIFFICFNTDLSKLYLFHTSCVSDTLLHWWNNGENNLVKVPTVTAFT
jgi:hypothetical protein